MRKSEHFTKIYAFDARTNVKLKKCSISENTKQILSRSRTGCQGMSEEEAWGKVIQISKKKQSSRPPRRPHEQSKHYFHTAK